MTRTIKYAELRRKLDKERTEMADRLLNLSEELSLIHSEINKNAFDRMLDDPLQKLDELMGNLKERKSFLCD